MNLSTAPFRNKAVLLLALVCCPLATADVPPSGVPARSEIGTLLQLNGSADIASQLGPLTAQQVIATLRKASPNLPVRADSVITNVVVTYIREQAQHDSVIDMLVPVYAKYLTKNDVEELIAFYRSPTGRKLASVTPAISFESTKIGQQWAESISPGLEVQLVQALRKEKLIQ